MLTLSVMLALPVVGGLVPRLPIPYSYVVVAGSSMEPTLSHGDIVVLRRQPDGYATGDTIAFRVPEGVGRGGAVIHRVVGGSGSSGYHTRGDNRTGGDLWRPRNGDVIGAAVARLPQAGMPLAIARSQAGMLFIALTIAAMAAMSAFRATGPR